MFPAGGSVTLTAGGQSLTLTGREAAMLVELALAADFIRPLDRGQAALHFAGRKVILSVTREDPPLHVAG